MDREILENWFHKHYVPEVWGFPERLQQKSVLMLDNAPSHPTERVLTSDDGHIIV
jgi:hypothetical protein